MIERIDVETPVAAPRGHRLESGRQIVEGAWRLAVEERVARQKRDLGEHLGLGVKVREILRSQEISVSLERFSTRVIEDCERFAARLRLGAEGAGRTPLDHLHFAARKPDRLSEALVRSRQGVESRDGGRTPRRRDGSESDQGHCRAAQEAACDARRDNNPKAGAAHLGRNSGERMSEAHARGMSPQRPLSAVRTTLACVEMASALKYQAELHFGRSRCEKSHPMRSGGTHRSRRIGPRAHFSAANP